MDGPGFLWLIDPDKIAPKKPDPRWTQAADCGVAAILIGTSQEKSDDFDCAVGAIRRETELPLILFPGAASQVSAQVDAVLFLNLLSGRNPDYLVGQQVAGTPAIREFGIEPIPTGYLLIDTGAQTSVAQASGTAPLAEDDIESIRNHALCAQYMGNAFVYLEAGSGAPRPIATQVIQSVRKHIDIPLIVGGGIVSPELCRLTAQAGADFVVVGTALENDPSIDLLREMIDAVRTTHQDVTV